MTALLPESGSVFLVKCIGFYEEMLRDISLCKKKGLDLDKEIECCFQIANNYCNQVINKGSSYDFASVTDEVFFYKKIRPLFFAEVEYYGLCSYVELFRATNEAKIPVEFSSFFVRESQRLEKFCKDNSLFVTYLVDDRKENDGEWFKRDAEKDGLRYDRLIGRYQALVKYVDYIKEETRVLK